MPLRVLYVDFNAYFASVEQELRPELRGKPVAVLPVIAETTCCIAASYEARRRGVRTGTLASDAQRLCPEIQFVAARPATYVDVHHDLKRAVESCAHVEKVLSIDEMYCLLSGSLQQRDRALALAREIKRAISRDVGTQLRCSIGIAPNVFLAKTASDLEKPDGLTVIEEADLPACLHGLELRDLCGIGEKMEMRLAAFGIHSVAALCRAGKMELRRVWGGINGEIMHARLRGEWTMDPPTRRSSLGHSHVLPPAMRSRNAAYAVLHRLLQKAAMRLRSRCLITSVLGVQVRSVAGACWDRQVRFAPTQDTLQLLSALKQLWKDYPQTPGMPPLAVGVRLLELEAQVLQSRGLFEDIDSRNLLNTAIDRLNLRYGKNTVYFGGAHFALRSAPMRIAFSHIPDPGIEGDL